MSERRVYREQFVSECRVSKSVVSVGYKVSNLWVGGGVESIE